MTHLHILSRDNGASNWRNNNENINKWRWHLARMASAVTLFSLGAAARAHRAALARLWRGGAEKGEKNIVIKMMAWRARASAQQQ